MLFKIFICRTQRLCIFPLFPVRSMWKLKVDPVFFFQQQMIVLTSLSKRLRPGLLLWFLNSKDLAGSFLEGRFSAERRLY